MIYGYCRVSTKSQLEGNGLQAQEHEILTRYEGAKIIDEQFTGAKADRPKLNELLDQLKEGDTLVVTKLDRLARNTVEGIQIVEGLFDKGVSVHVLNVGLLEKTAMGKFFLTTLLAVAEMERTTILERTSAGKDIAKLNPDFKEGRPKTITDEQEQQVVELHKEGQTQRAIVDTVGVSKGSVSRIINKYKETKNKRCSTCKFVSGKVKEGQGVCNLRPKKEIINLTQCACINYKPEKDVKKDAPKSSSKSKETTETKSTGKKLTKKHQALLNEFKIINTDITIVDVAPLVGEQFSGDAIALKVTLADGNWLRVYKNDDGEINWY